MFYRNAHERYLISYLSWLLKIKTIIIHENFLKNLQVSTFLVSDFDNIASFRGSGGPEPTKNHSSQFFSIFGSILPKNSNRISKNFESIEKFELNFKEFWKHWKILIINSRTSKELHKICRFSIVFERFWNLLCPNLWQYMTSIKFLQPFLAFP